LRGQPGVIATGVFFVASLLRRQRRAIPILGTVQDKFSAQLQIRAVRPSAGQFEQHTAQLFANWDKRTGRNRMLA